jgi:hypothetical protein
MRLTLRTLLAYMDGELERLYPQEAQEIGKKIEGSKFATDLFHKIRDVMRRLRLAAPSVTERGTNLDCNTVAEYLDNELPDDRVPDFEEACLQSEMHLAEVASCHQILAVAQVEPFEINPDSRDRMYQLPAVAGRVDDEHQAAVDAASVLSGDGAAPAAPAPPFKARPRPVVPEYLRDAPKKRRLLPAVAITLLLGALAALVMIVLGLDKPIVAWVDEKVSGKHEAAVDSAGPPSGNAIAAGSTGAPRPSGTAIPSGEVVKSSGSAPAASSSGTAAAGAARGTAAAPVELPLPPDAGPDLPAPGTGAPATVAPPDGAMPIKPLAKSDAGGAGKKVPIVPVKPPKAVIEPAPDGQGLPPPAGANAVPPPPKPLDPPGGAATAPAGANEIASAATKPPVNPAGGAKSNLSRYTSNGQDVLLTFDAARGFWRRALPEERFAAGQPLLEPPCYRSQIDVLDVGARIELINGTRVELLQSGPQGLLGVAIDFGRMVVRPLAQAGARLHVVAGSHTGTLTLASEESVAGVEVARFHEPGTDPEKVHSHAVTKLYVAGGSATWEEAGKRPVQLSAPGEFPLDGPAADAARGRAAQLPKWIAANTINELDQRAALAVSQSLPAERSAALSLLELTEDRRKEVRYLAARCLGFLGQFDPLRSALNDADYRVQWPDYIDELKEAVARGPETAAAIRQSFERQFGTDAPALYRMLWGYTDKDLEGGADAELVKDLDHETLIFRVLAFANLQKITGKLLTYRPEMPAAKRQPSVQRWKEKLRLGEIRWSPAAMKPKSPPVAAPPNPGAPGPPSPADSVMPDDVKPASDTEPIDSQPPRPSAASTARPKLVFPEPKE